jgi:protein-S-isoprenylcysteine O-methyltransferase Ste14
MFRRLLVPILILPFNVLVVVPALLVLLFRHTPWEARPAGPGDLRCWLAIPLVLAGLCLCAWTVTLFARKGQGTPAPWDPPRRLVVAGPYRHVRNPMITGVLLVLLGEALLLGSWPIFAWFCLFVLGNALYIPLVEEKRLALRYGQPYQDYRAHVPRWLPGLRGWQQ